jgi:dihydrofolate synthase/folylpolyglutamate synthase
MDYAESLAYLDALVLHGVKTGLDHTRRLAAGLGDPQKAYPCVLVAGTNGKGSTCAFLDAILGSAGVRTGFFSSPHLVDVRERIRVDGALIAPHEFAEGMTQVRRAEEAARSEGRLEGPPTYFEALTLLAFQHFQRKGVRVAVLEVGLGGRLDCTNVADPVVCVVTNVGLDHQEYLGHTLESIAAEKAGIFRPGVPVLTAARREGVLGVLEREARRVGALLSRVSEWRVAEGEAAWSLAGCGASLDLPAPSLLGEHQIANAALAVRAALALKEAGFPVTPDSIREGIAQARWPGRLERVASAPATYLDGAHNLDGYEVLARWAARAPGDRKALVVASMRDKAVESMAAILAPRFGAVWATGLPMSRSASPGEVRERWGLGEVRCEPNPLEALAQARRWAGPGGLVVAAGSLYLVGFLKAALQGEEPVSWGTGL